jgi:1-deoxyxylulose-5-phosphate synthase
MNYRQLGNSGVRVSVIGLGANRFGSENVPQNEVNRIIAAALDLGINFIDTSNNYTGGHSEERDEGGSYGGRVRRSKRHSEGK